MRAIIRLQAVAITTVFFLFVQAYVAFGEETQLETCLDSIIRSGSSEALGVAYSPNGKYLAFGGADNRILVRNLESGKVHNLNGHDKFVFALAFSPQSDLFATGGFDGSIIIWDCETGKELHRFRHHSPFTYQIAFSKDGKHIVSGSIHNKADKEGLISSWSIESAKESVIGRYPDIFAGSVAFSKNDKCLLVAGPKMDVDILDTISMKHVGSLSGHMGDIFHIRMTRDHRKLISTSSDCTAKVWEFETRKELMTYKGHKGKVTFLAIHPDGKVAATVGRISNRADNGFAEIHLWDTNNGGLLVRLGSDIGDIFGIDFSPDGRFLAAACGDGNVRIWKIIRK